MHEHSPESGSGTQILYYSTIATCVGGGYECVIIMCVISEYAEYGYACFSGSWQVGETKISTGGVSYACVNPTRYSSHASLTCFRTRPTRSSPELTPAMRTQDSGSTVSPGSSTRREHFSADTDSPDAPPWAKREQLNAEVSPLGSLA